MLSTTHPTGAAGTMRIDDDESYYVDFYLLGVNQLVEQIPWTYILNGQVIPWQAFRLEANTAWQKVTSLQVYVTQTITFRLGDSGNALIGGPTDFEYDVTRIPFVSDGQGYAEINVDGLYHQAIPYVKDSGEWKQAEPWARLLGEWKPAPT